VKQTKAKAAPAAQGSAQKADAPLALVIATPVQLFK